MGNPDPKIPEHPPQPPPAESPTPPTEPIVLDYRRPIPPRDVARFIRFLMLAVAILAIFAAARLVLNPVWGRNESLGSGVLGTPFAPITDSENNYWSEALFYLGIFLLMQWLFLSARGSWRIRLTLEGPPPKRAALAAGFIGMLLSIGLFATLAEIPNWWIKLTFPSGNVTDSQHSGIVSINGTVVDPSYKKTDNGQQFGILWIVMLTAWAAWTLVFWSYWKSLDRYSALQKVFRWLVAGTVLELAISMPAHAIVVQARGGDAYCVRGTWTSVTFGATVAFWLFGPGAFLLFLREKQRRERFD